MFGLQLLPKDREANASPSASDNAPFSPIPALASAFAAGLLRSLKPHTELEGFEESFSCQKNQ